MIELVNENTIASFKEFCTSDAFGCKLYSLITAYGIGELFADFWLCFDEERGISAALGRLDSTLTICAPLGLNEEISIFIQMLSGVKLIEMPSDDLKNSVVMRLSSYTGFKTFNKNTIFDDNLYEIYKLLCEADDNLNSENINAFYTDIHLRKRRGVLTTALVFDESLPAACAMAAFSQDSALIFSVACKPSKRNNGFASEAVFELCSQLELKNIRRENIFLFCQKHNISFYNRLGFTITGGCFINDRKYFFNKQQIT